MAESEFVILDERFRRAVKTSATVEKLFTGSRWAEGPAYFPAHRTLIWSDIPNDRMLRWDETSGAVGVFRSPAGYSNGNSVDPQGRLVTCEHGGRRVSRTEHDGAVITLADRYNGKRLNSPNDVVVRPDGSIWFTDPPYGIDSDYEGVQAESEIGRNHLYSIDPASGAVRIACDDFDRPNGLAFAPGGRKLYVADTGGTHTENGPRHIRVFDVSPDGKLSGGQVFAVCTSGFFDGFRFDTQGRLWASATDGVHCFDTDDGTLLGKILVPERVSNVCFGGPKGNRMFITATTSLYAVYLAANGATSA